MKNNKLYKYILVSLLIHALILFAFPLANQAGVGDDNKSQDFGFIELVEYKTITQTSQEAGEKPNNSKEVKKEKKEDKKPQPEKEENDEIEINENNNNIEEKAKEEPKEKTKEDTKEKVDKTNKKEKVEPEITEKDKNTEDDITESDNSEVISSEESDVEMEVEDKSQEKPENKKEKSGEESSDESNETDSTIEADDSEQEQEEAPPPPPTSGELIAKSISPQYPKDLIGENKKGTVKFLVNINQTGEIKNLRITDSSGIDKIDKTSRLAIERGWEFKAYNIPYNIPIVVDFKINEAGNPVIDVNLGEVDFKEVNN